LRESGFQEVTVTGRPGDGGIDGIGILQVSALVSFKVLFQGKKYAGCVGDATMGRGRRRTECLCGASPRGPAAIPARRRGAGPQPHRQSPREFGSSDHGPVVATFA